MLDDEDGDVCKAPVSDETHEIGDRGVEPVRTNDGDRKDPNILERSQMVRPCRLDHLHSGGDDGKHVSWYNHKPGNKDLKVEGCRIE